MAIETGTFAGWLLTALLHSSVLLGVAWLADTLLPARLLVLREWLWRTALYGALLTASAQALLSFEPLAGRWDGAAVAAVAMPAPPALQAVQVAAARPAVAAAPQVRDSVRSVPAWTRAVDGVRRNPALAIASLWAVLLAGAISRLLLHGLRLRRLLAHSPLLTDTRTTAIASRLAAFAGVNPPVLLRGSVPSPLATASGRILVPDWSLRDRPRLEGMLAHEIAHLARRDPLRQAADALAHALLFAHPLALLARRRLETIAELAADAWAARATGSGRALAEGLAACAERLAPAPRVCLATAMATPRSPLIHRIERLLENDIMTPEFRIPGLRALALVAIVAAAVALPAVGSRANAGERDDGDDVHVGNWSSTTDWGFGETFSAGIKRPGYALSVKAKGKFEFDAAEADVTSMGDGAVMEIEETRDGVTRRAEFEGDDGQVVRRYFVGGKERPLDAEGRTWLASAIPNMLRATGYDAEGRVGRILARGGADAVLDEIDRIPGDYARRAYLSELVQQARLEPAQFDRAIAQANDVESDFERRTILQAFLEAATLPPAQQAGVLDAAAGIESDFEKRTVLESAAEQAAPDPAVRAAWLRAAASIESSFERRSAIEAIAARSDAAWTAVAIEAARGIGSDFELRTALSALAPAIGESESLATAYASVTHEIGSDFERREALVALVEEAELNTAGFSAVLASAGDIEGDFECGEVLEVVAAHMPPDAALIAEYRRVARKLSDHERGQAERALDHLEI